MVVDNTLLGLDNSHLSQSPVPHVSENVIPTAITSSPVQIHHHVQVTLIYVFIIPTVATSSHIQIRHHIQLTYIYIYISHCNYVFSCSNSSSCTAHTRRWNGSNVDCCDTQ